jgi:CBS domain-containing protein
MTVDNALATNPPAGLPLAGEVMQTDVISVSPHASLIEVHRLFLEEEISGAPVIDDEGTVLGVISSKDLLRAVQDEYESGAAGAAPVYFREELPYSGPDWRSAPGDFHDRMAALTAADAMVHELIAVPPQTPVAEVARIMRAQRIHRVFVVKEQELLGIVTTFDLVGLLGRMG